MNRRSFLKTLLLSAGAVAGAAVLPEQEPDDMLDFGNLRTTDIDMGSVTHLEWDGYISHATVWDHALTDEQIAQLCDYRDHYSYQEKVLSMNPLVYYPGPFEKENSNV